MSSLVKFTAHSTPSNCFTQIYLTSIYLPVFVLISSVSIPFFRLFHLRLSFLPSPQNVAGITTLTPALVNNDDVF